MSRANQVSLRAQEAPCRQRCKRRERNLRVLVRSLLFSLCLPPLLCMLPEACMTVQSKTQWLLPDEASCPGRWHRGRRVIAELRPVCSPSCTVRGAVMPITSLSTYVVLHMPSEHDEPEHSAFANSWPNCCKMQRWAGHHRGGRSGRVVSGRTTATRHGENPVCLLASFVHLHLFFSNENRFEKMKIMLEKRNSTYEIEHNNNGEFCRCYRYVAIHSKSVAHAHWTAP